MIGFFSIIIGLIIVWLAYKVLVKEIDKGFGVFSEKYPGINDHNTKTILDQFDKMENLVNDLNSTYYDFVSELEGHYSVHDKELQLLEGRLSKTESELRALKSALSSEVKNRQKAVQSTQMSQPRGEASSNTHTRPPSGQDSIAASTTGNVQVENSAHLSKPNRKLDLLSLSEHDKETLRKQIIDLRHKGFNLAQIARELDVGVGELQLFLNLNKIR